MATNTGVDVGVASAQILAANNDRKYAIIVNDSDTTIYLAIGAAAVAHRGIRLNANGGSYEVLLADLNIVAINGIHAGAGNKRVTVVEDTYA